MGAQAMCVALDKHGGGAGSLAACLCRSAYATALPEERLQTATRGLSGRRRWRTTATARTGTRRRERRPHPSPRGAVDRGVLASGEGLACQVTRAGSDLALLLPAVGELSPKHGRTAGRALLLPNPRRNRCRRSGACPAAVGNNTGPSNDRLVTLFCPDGRLYQVGECAYGNSRGPNQNPKLLHAAGCAIYLTVLLRVSAADYAWNAVRLAGVTSVGVRGADSVCVVGQQRARAPKDKLLETASVSRLFPITERVGLLATGIAVAIILMLMRRSLFRSCG
ncbi:proteasome subunit alpha type 6 [Panicum miliaceum]|uniref:Proteasome subunit alpha type 6 n=1 Tax=Panicum miliaceum TaxID=4540 RepID=A0A3L6TBR9_PANMI|nr:proteasome subunit alpha type 6 [Panicum miliaceum]